MKNRDTAKPQPIHAPGRRREPPGMWRTLVSASGASASAQQRAIDALLRHHGDGVGIELQFFLEGGLALGRLYPDRELAVAAAEDKRHELERAGWVHHW